MKVKMVKMGMDIDETRNRRIRGIVPTDDGKFLFVEILQGNRPNIIHTNMKQKEYDEKYPYAEYVFIDFCFRVDVPEDYYKNYTSEYAKYTKGSFTNLEHNKNNIIKILQEFNKNIDDIELVDENYIAEYCNSKGFYELYDSRLQHEYVPKEILWSDFEKDGVSRVKFLYTCYSANGEKYQEEMNYDRDNSYLIETYGTKTIRELLNNYINDKCINIDKNVIEKMFEGEKQLENELEMD